MIYRAIPRFGRANFILRVIVRILGSGMYEASMPLHVGVT